MVYGIVIACILIAVGLFVYFNYPFFPSKPEIDMRQKIEEELPNGYSIYEYDWIVWSKTARDSGLVLTKMDTWEQFEESYKQTPYVFVMMLDEKNRVVWFKPYVNHAIYYEYQTLLVTEL